MTYGEEIMSVKDLDGAIAPTRLIRIYSGTMVDAWTGAVLDDRNACSLEDIRRIVEREGRPVDVEVDPGRWLRVWPDGCYLQVREPAAMTRRKKIIENRRKEVRKERRRARRRARVARLLKVFTRKDSDQEQEGGGKEDTAETDDVARTEDMSRAT